MKIKKIMSDTLGVSIGAVGISAGNSIGAPYGNLIGSSMAAGLLKKIGGKK